MFSPEVFQFSLRCLSPNCGVQYTVNCFGCFLSSTPWGKCVGVALSGLCDGWHVSGVVTHQTKLSLSLAPFMFTYLFYLQYWEYHRRTNHQSLAFYFSNPHPSHTHNTSDETPNISCKIIFPADTKYIITLYILEAEGDLSPPIFGKKKAISYINKLKKRSNKMCVGLKVCHWSLPLLYKTV